ncbi:MAG: hypothetical protein KDA21_04035 [Phycisphaerales bacterium]|nr:hypothetical protein [Phycisphaerales bacterium]
MFIDGLTNADALPVLEASAQVAAQRHRLISNNIANISTPDYVPTDISVPEFQQDLARAVARRRRAFGGARGDLNLDGSAQLRRDERGELRIRPQSSGRNILFHDRNNRDLERLMQDLAENTAAFRVATEFIRAQTEVLASAITERP